jgi:hypothetical protein
MVVWLKIPETHWALITFIRSTCTCVLETLVRPPRQPQLTFLFDERSPTHEFLLFPKRFVVPLPCFPASTRIPTRTLDGGLHPNSRPRNKRKVVLTDDGDALQVKLQWYDLLILVCLRQENESFCMNVIESQIQKNIFCRIRTSK